jgi:WD40 repeat protein
VSSVEIWNLETGQPVHIVRLRFEYPGRLSFSADGSTLIVMSRSRAEFELFNTETGRSLGAPIEVDGHIASVLLSGDGGSIAVVLEDWGVLLLNAETGEIRASVALLDSRPEVSFSPEGGTLLVKSGASAWLVDTRDGKVRGEIRHEGGIAKTLFSPDGRTLVTTGERRMEGKQTKPKSQVRIWDAQTASQLLKFSRNADATEPVSFSPNGELLLVTNTNGYEVYDAQTWRRRGGGRARGQRCMSDSSSDPGCRRTGFSADGRAVYTLAWQHRVARLVQTELPELVLRHPEKTSNVALSPDATRLLTVTRNGSVQLWDLTKKTAIEEPSAEGDRVNNARFSRDGKWAVTEHGYGEFHTWEVETGRFRALAIEDSERSAALMLGQAGTLVMVRDREGQLWDFDSNALSSRNLLLPPDIDQFSFSGDGHLLATTSYGADVLIWDATTGSEVNTLNPRSGVVQNLQESETVLALAFSSDSTRLLTATSYGTVRIWDVASGQLAKELLGPTDGIDNVLFSPDGEVIASIHGSDVRLWDVTTGQLIQDFIVWSAETLAFSTDGQYLFIASPHATFRWRVPHLPDEPERIRSWVDVLSLARWSKQGSPTPIGLSSWMESWESLDEHGGPFQ